MKEIAEVVVLDVEQSQPYKYGGLWQSNLESSVGESQLDRVSPCTCESDGRADAHRIGLEHPDGLVSLIRTRFT